jgi:hypothetical protein
MEEDQNLPYKHVFTYGGCKKNMSRHSAMTVIKQHWLYVERILEKEDNNVDKFVDKLTLY